MNEDDIEHYRWRAAIAVLQNAFQSPQISSKDAAKLARQYADAFVEAMLMVADSKKQPSLSDLCEHVFGSENQDGTRECLICGFSE